MPGSPSSGFKKPNSHGHFLTFRSLFGYGTEAQALRCRGRWGAGGTTCTCARGHDSDRKGKGGKQVGAWLWGVLSVIGVTVLAGITKRLVDSLFERSASLVVRVTINKAFKSPLLFKDVYEFKEKARAPGERADFSWRSHGRLHDYFHAEQYVHIGVRNNSNRKLSSLTFCAHSIGGAMLQIGDGEMIEVKADQPIPLGDLQPRREIILHLLAGSFWGGYAGSSG